MRYGLVLATVGMMGFMCVSAKADERYDLGAESIKRAHQLMLDDVQNGSAKRQHDMFAAQAHQMILDCQYEVKLANNRVTQQECLNHKLRHH